MTFHEMDRFFQRYEIFIFCLQIVHSAWRFRAIRHDNILIKPNELNLFSTASKDYFVACLLLNWVFEGRYLSNQPLNNIMLCFKGIHVEIIMKIIICLYNNMTLFEYISYKFSNHFNYIERIHHFHETYNIMQGRTI